MHERQMHIEIVQIDEEILAVAHGAGNRSH